MPETTMPKGTSPRAALRSLGWPAILAATLLAALAAGGVFVLLDGSDDGAAEVADPATDGSLELVPMDELGEPLGVTFLTPEGDDATLAEVVEGPTVVNFFASWCPPCVAEMPDFEQVSQELGDEVRFFGLAVNDRTAEARSIVESTGVTYDWGRDAEGRVATAAGVLNMPATMFIDASGEVVEVHSGALDADELRELIEEHLGVTA